jgi:hypothetical protein
MMIKIIPNKFSLLKQKLRKGKLTIVSILFLCWIKIIIIAKKIRKPGTDLAFKFYFSYYSFKLKKINKIKERFKRLIIPYIIWPIIIYLQKKLFS